MALIYAASRGITEAVDNRRLSEIERALAPLLAENPFEPQLTDSVELQLAKGLIDLDERGIPRGFYFLASLPYDPDSGKFIVHYRSELPDFLPAMGDAPPVPVTLHETFIRGMERYWGDYFEFREATGDKFADITLAAHIEPFNPDAYMSTLVISHVALDPYRRPYNRVVVNTLQKDFNALACCGDHAAREIFGHEFGHVVGFGHTQDAVAKLPGEWREGFWLTNKRDWLAYHSMMYDYVDIYQGSSTVIDGLANFMPETAKRGIVADIAFDLLREFVFRACHMAAEFCQQRNTFQRG